MIVLDLLIFHNFLLLVLKVSKRATTIWGAIKKRSYYVMLKTYTKKAKRGKAAPFAITNLENQ